MKLEWIITLLNLSNFEIFKLALRKLLKFEFLYIICLHLIAIKSVYYDLTFIF